VNLRSLAAALSLLLALAGAALAQPVQQAELFDYSDGGAIAGSFAELLRTDGAVGVEMHTFGLEANHPYTAWWVIFNSPTGCNGACNADDIFDADGKMDPNVNAGVSILFADGTIADADGNASFSALLAVGRPFGQSLTGAGLVNPRNAEIHMVVRHHGELKLANAYGQLNQASSCPDCFKADVQFTIFSSDAVESASQR
jgi:hypothetical protein